MWTVDYQEDIESDLSAFHRVDDPLAIPGPRYFLLALRLSAYMGVMGARAAEAERQGQDASPATSSAAPGAGQTSRVEDSTVIAMLAADGWVEHNTEGA